MWQMARSCSLYGDTIHYGYSMNWSRDVFGTNILDHGISVRSDIIDEANKTAKKLYQNRSWDAYLRLPPPCNPINTTGGAFLSLVTIRNGVTTFSALAVVLEFATLLKWSIFSVLLCRPLVEVPLPSHGRTIPILYSMNWKMLSVFRAMCIGHIIKSFR